MRSSLILISVAALLSAQDETRQQKRRVLSADPDTLVAQLTSANPREAQALFEFAEIKPAVSNAEWRAVNLDDDPELERIVTAESGGTKMALVLKRIDGAWWVLGDFGHSSAANDPFLETKATVQDDHPDLIVRTGGAMGSDLWEQELAVYRIRDGYLYRVFEATDFHSYALTVSNLVTFPSPGTILVRSRRNQEGRRSQVTQRYVWNQQQFRFIAR